MPRFELILRDSDENPKRPRPMVVKLKMIASSEKQARISFGNFQKGGMYKDKRIKEIRQISV